MTTRDDVVRVIFVCTGNICRSPMADAVFRRLITQAGLSHRVASTSAGTGDWHVGERADPRALDALARRGYDGEQHRAKQFVAADFERFDLIIALDRSHARILQSWAGNDGEGERVSLLMSYAAEPAIVDVPDPYYADATMFDEVLVMIEAAAVALFSQLEPAVRTPSRPRTDAPSPSV